MSNITSNQNRQKTHQNTLPQSGSGSSETEDHHKEAPKKPHKQKKHHMNMVLPRIELVTEKQEPHIKTEPESQQITADYNFSWIFGKISKIFGYTSPTNLEEIIETPDSVKLPSPFAIKNIVVIGIDI